MRALLVLFASAALAAAVPSQTLVYNLEMISEQEVPPLQTGGIGTATVTLDTATGMVTVSGSYMNMSGSVIAAHIHGPARRGANGGVIMALSHTGGTSGTISGSGTFTPSQVSALRDGLTYVNIHSTAAGGGEIRGQIDTVPGSGSPNSAAPTITGAATSGGTLQVACPPTINSPFIIVGFSLPSGQTIPLPAAIACVVPTGIGFDIALPVVVIPGFSISVPIPAGAPSVHVAFQCALVPPPRNCVDLSAASRVAIRP